MWIQSTGSSKIESSDHKDPLERFEVSYVFLFCLLIWHQVLGVDCRCLVRLFHVGSAAQRGESTRSLRQCFLGWGQRRVNEGCNGVTHPFLSFRTPQKKTVEKIRENSKAKELYGLKVWSFHRFSQLACNAIAISNKHTWRSAGKKNSPSRTGHGGSRTSEMAAGHTKWVRIRLRCYCVMTLDVPPFAG